MNKTVKLTVSLEVVYEVPVFSNFDEDAADSAYDKFKNKLEEAGVPVTHNILDAWQILTN